MGHYMGHHASLLVDHCFLFSLDSRSQSHNISKARFQIYFLIQYFFNQPEFFGFALLVQIFIADGRDEESGGTL